MDYAELLQANFGVTLPESTPTYLQRYAYNECVNSRWHDGIAKELKWFATRFPWKNLSLEEVKEALVEARKTRYVAPTYEDDTVVYQTSGRNAGKFFFYFGGVIAARSKRLDVLKEIVKERFNKEILDDSIVSA
jgi:hypothetical protein